MAQWSELMRGAQRDLRIGGRIVFGSGREYILTDEMVSSLIIEEGVDGALAPGSVLCASCTLDLVNDQGQWSAGGSFLGANELSGAVILPELGAAAGDEILWRPMGVYQVENAVYLENEGCLRLTACDSIARELADPFEDGLGYPCTLREIWDHAISQTRFAWEGEVPNGNAVIDLAPDWKDASLRTALGYIACAAGCFVCVDRNGALKLCPLWDGEAEIQSICAQDYFRLEQAKDGYGPVDSLRLKPAGAQEERVYRMGESALFALSVAENPLLRGDAPGLDAAALGMLECVAGFTSAALRFEWRGDPELYVGGRIELEDTSGTVHTAVLSRQTMRCSAAGFSASCCCAVPEDNNSGVRRLITPEGGLNAGALTGAVDGALLSVGSITTQKLAAGSITAEKIASGALDAITLDAVTAKIENLTASDIETDHLAAALAAFTILTAGTATFDQATVAHLVARAMNLEFGVAGQVFIRNLAVEYAQMVGAAIGNLCIKASDGYYYNIDVSPEGTVTATKATVSNSEINAGQTDAGRVILETSITAEQLNTGNLLATYALVNRIDAARIDVDQLFAREAFIALLRTSKIVGEKSITMIAGEVESNAEAIQRQNADFVSAVTRIDGALADLQSQVDGSIVTWYLEGEPTAENEPAVNWNTDELREQHKGDLYFDTLTGYSYRWLNQAGVWQWQRLADTDAAAALEKAAKAQDTADSKRRIFIVQPVPPYDVGDLWAQGGDGEILVCAAMRISGQSFSENDWVPASKYTDDTRADEAYALANTGVARVDVEYYLSDSTAELTGGQWQSIAPEWVNGKYMWSRTVTRLKDGTAIESDPVCIAGAKGETGSTGVGVEEIQEEYYLSTSKIALVGGQWTDKAPEWKAGCYIWSRSRIIYTDGTESTTEPYCDVSWEIAAEAAKDASPSIFRQAAAPSVYERVKANDLWVDSSTGIVRQAVAVNVAWCLGDDGCLHADLPDGTSAEISLRDLYSEGFIQSVTEDGYALVTYSWALVRDSEIEAALNRLVDAVDGKTTTYYGAQPDNPAANDIWYDTANGRIRRYTGSAWEDITGNALKAALDAAGDAQATADGKIVTYAQATAPTAASKLAPGDLWIDTDDKNRLYRWNGSSWVSSRDKLIEETYTALNDLIDVVDGKTTTYYGGTQPSDPSVNDIWYDTANGRIKRYTGTGWADITNNALKAALDAAAAAEDSASAAQSTADKAQSAAGTAQSTANSAQTAAGNAQAAANKAQATADGKIVTFAQAGAPKAAAIGDLWIDTDDQNKLYRWSGSAWVPFRDQMIVDAMNQALFATIHDGEEPPAAPIPIGKVWIDRSAAPPVLRRWLGLNLEPENPDGWETINDLDEINRISDQLAKQQAETKAAMDNLSTALTVEKEGVHIHKPGYMNQNEVFIDEDSVDVKVGGEVFTSMIPGGLKMGRYMIWRPEEGGGLAFNMIT